MAKLSFSKSSLRLKAPAGDNPPPPPLDFHPAGARLDLLSFTIVLVIVAGYFGPWVAHPAAGLNLSADDLSEWVKFLPTYKAGHSGLIRELFCISIWLAPIGLGMLAGRSRSWLMKLALLGPALLLVFTPLPKYPELLTAYQAPEFAPTFWITAGSLVITLGLSLLGRRAALTDRLVAALWIIFGLAVALIAPLHFIKVLSEIERLYHVSIGWGLVATVLGGLSLSALGARQWRQMAALRRADTA
jgi:hypothetical protein